MSPMGFWSWDGSGSRITNAGSRKSYGCRILTTAAPLDSGVQQPGLIQCDCCLVSLAPGGLSAHYLSSPNHPKCAACTIGFKDISQYSAHMILDHGTIGCDQCPAVFETAEALQWHHQSHLPDWDAVDDTGSAMAGLCENEATNESQERRCRTCNICGAQFDEKKELRTHKRAVHMFCATCNALLGTSVKAYKKHMRKRHPFFSLRPSSPPPKTSPHYPGKAKGAPRRSAPPATFNLSNVDHARSESTDWSDDEDSISDSEESEIEQAGPASPEPQAVTDAELSTGLIEQPSHLDISTPLRSASELNSPVVDDQYGGPLASAGAFGEAATLAGSAVDDVETPRTYDIFRCPVCDKSYYTLEVLSNHMLDNGHGRFGSVRMAGTRHKRIESAPASTAAFNISAAGMTPDTPVVPDRTPRATAGGGSTAPTPAYMTSVMAHQADALSATSKAIMDEHSAYNLSFSTEGEINARYRAPDAYPSCHKCGAIFQDMDDLSKHCESAHGTGTLASRTVGKIATENRPEAWPDRAECARCGAVFEGDAELLEHKRSSHTFEYCARCDRWYSARHLLLRHFYESPEQHPRCTECRVGFAGDEEHSAHLATGHGRRALQIAPQFGGEQSVRSVAGPGPRPWTPPEGLASAKLPVVAIDNALDEVSASVTSSIATAKAPSPPNPVPPLANTHTLLSDTIAQSSERRAYHGRDSRTSAGTSSYFTAFDSFAESEVFSDGYSDDSSTCFTSAQESLSTLKLYVDEEPVSASGATVFTELDRADDAKHVLAEVSPASPCSDACTFGWPTRPASPFPAVDLNSNFHRAASAPPRPSVFAQDNMNLSSVGARRSSLSPPLVTSKKGWTMKAATTAMAGGPLPASTASAMATDATSRRRSAGPSWRCRHCGMDPCEDPTATQCGHIFCYSCIMKVVAESLACPVCHRMFFVRLQAY